MIGPAPLEFEIQCPVCSSIMFYPDLVACDQCGWPVLVYGAKPDPARMERFHTAKAHRAADHKALQAIKSSLDTQQSKANDLARIFQELGEHKKKLQATLLDSLNQENELAADPIFVYDLEQLEQEYAVLRTTKVGLEALISKAKPKITRTTIRCTYDEELNHIKAEVVQMPSSGSGPIELFLGLAVSAKHFDHYHTAEMVIPVKDREKPVKIIETGMIFILELAQRPEKTAVYRQIIHLYGRTTSKFKII